MAGLGAVVLAALLWYAGAGWLAAVGFAGAMFAILAALFSEPR